MKSIVNNVIYYYIDLWTIKGKESFISAAPE